MGAGASRAQDGETDVYVDDEAFDRARKEGLPFTLLHDEAFVMEKYQEIMRSRDSGFVSKVDGGLEVTGEDELPMDELELMADAARVKVFVARANSVEDKEGEEGNGDDTSSAASLIEGTTMTRACREYTRSQQRREQQCGIAADFMAQVAKRMEKHAIAAQERKQVWEQQAVNAEPGKTTATSSSVQKRLKKTSAKSLGVTSTGASLFKLGSLRMHLRMIRSMRTVNPVAFESGILSLVQTVLEFPPFVLQAPNNSEGNSSLNLLLLDEVYQLCSDLFKEKDLSAGHRDLLLLLVLAFGVCSGRSAYLLEFVTSIFGQLVGGGISLASTIDDSPVLEWVHEVMSQMDSYRVQYSLGSLKEDDFLKAINIKEQSDSDEDNDDTSPKQPPSIATDGSYVYVWNIEGGLQKIGTGYNFTVAGRVYAKVPAERYLQALRPKRVIHAAFIGSGADVTQALRGALLNQDSLTTVHGIMSTSGEVEPGRTRRLYVQWVSDSKIHTRVLNDDEAIELSNFDGMVNATEAKFALYGDFVQATDSAVENLKTRVFESENRELFVDLSLLSDLQPESTTDTDFSGEEELLVLRSCESSPHDLVLDKLSLCDVISGYEDISQDVYHSSLTCCRGQLHLSLLQPGAYTEKSPKLLAISPSDLSVRSLSAGAEEPMLEGSQRPVVTYISEGKDLYEIKVLVDRLQISVFHGAPDLKTSSFKLLRQLDIDLSVSECGAFTSGFSGCIELVNAGMGLGELNLKLPSFYTNGSLLCLMLPKTPESGSGDDSKCTFQSLMFDCVANKFVHVDGDETTLFERILPGPGCCFDANNNLLWVVNPKERVMNAYRNPGRKVPVDGENELGAVPSSVATSNSGADLIAARVLSFVVQHLDDDGGASSASQTASAAEPFAVQLDDRLLELLLNLAVKFAEKRRHGSASTLELHSLGCILRVLRRAVDDAMNSLSCDAQSLLASLHSRLPGLLSTIIQDGSDEQARQSETSIQDIDLGVVSAAVALSAVATHLVDTDLDSQLERGTNLVSKWRSGHLTKSDEVIAVSLFNQLRRTTSLSDDEKLKAQADRFAALWMELVGAEVDQMSAAAEDPSALKRELGALVNLFMQTVFIRAEKSEDMLKLALKVFRVACHGLKNVCSQVLLAAGASTGAGGEVYSGELLRQVAPTVFANATMFLRSFKSRGGDSAKVHDAEGEIIGSFLLSDWDCLLSLLKELNALVVALDVEAKSTTSSTVSRTTKTAEMESSHQYENDLDEIRVLRIPGTKQMTITFDQRTRTENGYDYLTFYKDESQTDYYGERKYTGRDSDMNWPGVDGHAALVIDSDHCYVYFHTDGSNTDWGYKLTAVGDVFEKTTITQRHWLSSLTEMALGIVEEVGSMLIDGTKLVVISESEAQADDVLKGELLRRGSASEAERNTGVVQLLEEFIHPLEGSRALSVLRSVEQKHAGNRLGRRPTLGSSVANNSIANSSSPINVAIRAATAAIVHHNMWGMDAYALAQELRADVSDELLKGWKNAQKMRDWFHLGDATRSVTDSLNRRSSSRKLHSQPSAYSGTTEEDLEVLSHNVVQRALFLLELTPMAQDNERESKRRWTMLAKYSSALRNASSSLSQSSSDASLGKWFSLVDELQGTSELRNLLDYQKKSSERRKHNQTKSITELVLEFIQSDVDVSELRKLVELRNKRAEYRAQGLLMFAHAMASCSTLRHKTILVESFASIFHALALSSAQEIAQVLNPTLTSTDAVPSSRIHVTAMLAGCDSELRRDVLEAFGRCLIHFSQDLSIDEASDEQGRTDHMVSTLKALCFDYNADDMDLLYETNVLQQVLSLMQGESGRLRRSAQVLLDVLLSRLSSPFNHEATLFQKHLYETVGLQLEKMADTWCKPGGSILSPSSPYNLANSTRSWTLPVSDTTNLRWNHSIMLWMYVPLGRSSYALKVGDAVRYGPSWPGEVPEEATGVVTAIVDSTTVKVTWSPSGVVSEHQFDSKVGVLEVVRVDEGIGGVVFSKGSRNTASDCDDAAPWSYFGLYLDDQRQLSYKIACGATKECEYKTGHALDADEWSHVAVVQNEDQLEFFVNGALVSQHTLDPLLVMDKSFCSAKSKVIESPHPVLSPCDHYWPVQIPGASKIRVTFDPLCESDASGSYLRFFKNGQGKELWGEKYSAEMSKGSFVIPSDHFRVHFDKCGSEAWGFRILATPEFESVSQGSPIRCALNAFPIFIGSPPSRIANEPAAKCWVLPPHFENKPLKDAALKMMCASPPSCGAPEEVSIDDTLHSLGLVLTCCESTLGREMIATPENVGNLIRIAFEDCVPLDVRCASVAVLKQLCTKLSKAFVCDQFQRVYPGQSNGSFAQFIFERLASALNGWATQDNRLQSGGDPAGQLPSQLQISSDELMVLVTVYVSLLRRLARTDEWMGAVVGSMENAFARWQELLDDASDPSETSAQWKSASGGISSALALIGGNYPGVVPGDRVKCTVPVGDKLSVETGSLVQLRQRGRSVIARVLLDSDARVPVDVPIVDMECISEEHDQELTEFVHAVAPKLVTSSLRALAEAILTSDDLQVPSTKLNPRIIRKENFEVLESEHPYSDGGGGGTLYTLHFNGAKEIVVEFDSQSSTANRDDYVTFLKRIDDCRNQSHPEAGNGKTYWGEERYFGTRFPGVGDVPRLVIPASSFGMMFNTNSSNGWGFKMTARAVEEVVVYPPEVAPSAKINAVADIRSQLVKSLHTCVRTLEGSTVMKAWPLLIPSLVAIANAPDRGRPTQRSPVKKVFESKHPYENNTSETIDVRFSGASRLIVTFDPETKTELDADLVCFYKDRSFTDKWGEVSYSGVDFNANWPGLKGTPPLIISSDSFTLKWTTDRNNTEWGWKFTVLAEFPIVTPMMIPIQHLSKQAQELWALVNDGIAVQEEPLPEQLAMFEVAADGEPAQRSDPAACILRTIEGNKNEDRVATVRKNATYRVVEADGLDTHASPDVTSPSSGRLDLGAVIEVFATEKEWLKVKMPDGENDAVFGWLRRRTGDRMHVKSVDAWREEENVLVLGVDDTEAGRQQSRSPFYLDESTEVGSKRRSSYSYEVLRGQMHRLPSLAYDTHRAVAVQLARDLLRMLMCSADADGPRDELLQLDAFGTPADFLTLLAHLFKSDDMIVDENKLEATLRILLRGDDAHGLVQKCIDVLGTSPSMLPKGRGVMRVVESAHPYTAELDEYSEICIPGAKKMLVYFDPRSKTEPGYDYVKLYKMGTDRSECFGQDAYSGRNGAENWPGCGGRPPLVVGSDRMEVYFHTDQLKHDWGFKLYAVGVVEDDDSASDGVDSDTLVSMVRIAMWILQIAAEVSLPDKTSRVAAGVFSVRLFDALVASLREHPQRIQAMALKTIKALVKNAAFLHSLPAARVEDLRNMLLVRLRAQGGEDEKTKSELVQTLVECLLFVDIAIDSATFQQPPKNIAFSDKDLVFTRISDATGDFQSLIACEPDDTAVHRFTLLASSQSLALSIISSGENLIKWTSNAGIMVSERVRATHTISGPCAFATDDIVTVHLDAKNGFLELRRNHVCLVSGSWSPSTGSRVTISLASETNDAVIGYRKWTAAPLALQPLANSPSWYTGLCDSMRHVLDFAEDRVSGITACESEHPLTSSQTKESAAAGHRTRVSIAGALALEVRFDRRTELAMAHQLQFYSAANDVALAAGVWGISGQKCDEDYPALFLTEMKAAVRLSPGDHVARSSDWCYNDEDGGAGGVGVVEEITPWNGESDCGVRVRWARGEQSNSSQLYRYGYKGAFDVQLVRQLAAWDSPLVIVGDTLEYVLHVALEDATAETTVWGYRFYVIPHFSFDSIGRRRFQTQGYQYAMDGPALELRHDQQLIKYVNKVASAKQMDESRLLQASWSEFVPSEDELVKWPVLVEIATGTSAVEDHSKDPEAVARATAMDRLGKRFNLLRDLNRAFSRLLPYVSFVSSPVVEGRREQRAIQTVSTSRSSDLSDFLTQQRYRMMHPIKRAMWDDVLDRSSETWAKTDVTFNRLKAMRHRVSGKTDNDGRFALFSQAFRALNGLPVGHFRRTTALYKVHFLGENAQDAGGPYRETLAQFTEELHSSQLPLLIASSNTQHNVGAAREKWVLNPSSTSATALKMFEFLGKLMGAAMRSQEYMPMQIAVLIWKKLTGETVTTDDLALVDSMIVNSMDKIRTIDQCGVTADVFEDIVMETFTTLSTDNRTVALKPNGASIPVTFDSRIEFADLVEAYRLREFDVQIEAILRGLATVVPVHLLSLFTGVEMELMVCGSPEVDVDLLQRCTEYSSCRATDNHIVWFWEVLRAFSHEERSAFLRFVWGRSRLPANEKEFPQRFKLQSFNKSVSGSVDRYLPISHTCFFSVEMPRYSSASVLRERLLYAMYNCQEIDADGDTIAANQLNWEE